MQHVESVRVVVDRFAERDLAVAVLGAAIGLWGIVLVLMTMIQVLQTQTGGVVRPEHERDRLQLRLVKLAGKVSRMNLALFGCVVLLVVGLGLCCRPFVSFGTLAFLWGCCLIFDFIRVLGRDYV